MSRKSTLTVPNMSENKKINPSPYRGDIYLADMKLGIGSEQAGIRPVLVIQNDIGNKFSPVTIVAVITKTKTNRAELPMHVHLDHRISALERDSTVLLEQIRTIDKRRLIKYVSQLDKQTMKHVDRALKISLGIASAEEWRIDVTH